MGERFKSSGFQLLIINSSFLLITSCSVQKQIHQSAQTDVLESKALQTAHVGISIFDPSANKYLYNYQGDHYFVPASNIKIPTCYAAMKYLGDSLVGLKYGFSEDKDSSHIVLAIQPTGDPTFLHKDFKRQTVWQFLSQNALRFKERIAILDTIWEEERWGNGWSWNDYRSAYMAEKNVMPIFGNVIDLKLNEVENRNIKDTLFSSLDKINLLKTQYPKFDSWVNNSMYLIPLKQLLKEEPMIKIDREISGNMFWFRESSEKFSNRSIPFVTIMPGGYWKSSYATTTNIISDSLKYRFGSIWPREGDTSYTYSCPDCRSVRLIIKKWNLIHSQPTDSVLKPMMHRSDNFFAEQMLLMLSNEMLGVMNDEKIIDTLLKTDFKDLPQKPRWVDGSGLSRYNLFSPQDFVAILNKMKNEFGMDRIKEIFPTGGEGTISNYFKADSGYIYAKTGTLSGVVAFSGFLYTKKGKLLIFSTLVNNHNDSAIEVRKAIENFLQAIRNRY